MLPDELQRTRLINFRVTPKEFKTIQEHANSLGCRGLSEYCRKVVLGAGDAKPESQAFLEMQTRLKVAESKLELLSRRVDGMDNAG